MLMLAFSFMLLRSPRTAAKIVLAAGMPGVPEGAFLNGQGQALPDGLLPGPATDRIASSHLWDATLRLLREWEAAK